MADVIDLQGFGSEVSAITRRLALLQERAQNPAADPTMVEDALEELQTTVEELRVSYEELTAQNEALTESRRVIEDEHARYRSLFQRAPVAYLVTDVRGVVIEANQTAIDLLNVDERFLRSKPLATFLVPAHRSAARQQISVVAETGERQVAEWDVSPRRQPPVPAAFTITRLRGDDPDHANILLWLIQDLRTERTLRSHAARLTAQLRRSQQGAADSADPAVELALHELSTLLFDEFCLDDVLQAVAATGLDLIPGATGVSVSLFEQGRPRVGGMTAPWVKALDEIQYSLQEGPCLAALEDGAWRAADNLDEENRWPRFAAEAAAQGILSAIAVPLLTRGARLGVINIYSSGRAAFGVGAVTIAQLLAERASVVVANAQLLYASRRLAEELEAALTTRATVDMAKGILMARLGVDADGAFDALRDLSQRRHVKLRELAAELVRSSAAGPQAGQGGPSGATAAGKR